jgi:hypothetical protein
MSRAEDPSFYDTCLQQAGLAEASIGPVTQSGVVWGENSSVALEERGRYEGILTSLRTFLRGSGIDPIVSRIELFGKTEETPTTCMVVIGEEMTDGEKIHGVIEKMSSSFAAVRRFHGPLGWQFVPRFPNPNTDPDAIRAVIGPNPRLEAIAR